MTKRVKKLKAFDYKGASIDALKKLDPRVQIKNLVMFVVFIGAIICTLSLVISLFGGTFSFFEVQITFWLWATILFANFAEALAERRGKAQADSLKSSKATLMAKCFLAGHGEHQLIPATQLKKGMIILCEANDIIPADGDVIEGIASVDESVITGESASVIREAGSDRSGVMAGTKVVSDWIKIVVSTEVGESYLDKMIQLIENAKRSATPNEKALNICLVSLSLLFIVATVTLKFFIGFIENQNHENAHVSLVILSALLVCLIPTTISGLLSAIGISGMERLLRKNVLAKSGKAVEAAGDIDVLLLDKTGTITHGARMAYEFYPAIGVKEEDLATYAFYASAEDLTPEGKSISQLAMKKGVTQNLFPKEHSHFIPFTAETRMSGVDVTDESGKVVHRIRKGAVESVSQFAGMTPLHNTLRSKTVSISSEGGTPLLVAYNEKIVGVIYLKDIIKTGIRERFAQLRQMGIKTVMITGDNPLTAATIAAEAGVDDFIAESTPEAKLKKILDEQAEGRMVAMIGDGTNDAPALAQADVGVAMNSGTSAAKEASNMVDLDSDPTKLLEIIETGKELLMARGSLTTFSIANDIAKYFTILPAIFSGLFLVKGESVLSILNILHLHSPQSAILSAVIFNALIIMALIPLAIRGVPYQPLSAMSMLRRNVFIYGLGGVICPFIGIKIIDLFLTWSHLA